MTWFSRTFTQNTIMWVTVSAVIGAMVGASVKFVFEDLLRPYLGVRGETRRVLRQYTTPLIRSGEALERRINILVRNERKRWFENDEFFCLSTLYIFGEHLGWIRIIEQKFGFLPFETLRGGRQFNMRLNGIFRALTSHAYFRWHPDSDAVSESEIPRLMLSAVGEMMIVKSNPLSVIQFTDFARAYASDQQFRQWFSDLASFLSDAHPSSPLRWDRLIAAGANLRALIRFLDRRGSVVPIRSVVNLERTCSREIREILERDFRPLLPPPSKAAPR